MYLGLLVRPMRKRGFTLIELLVVISVLSLLIAVLMPALARARAQGKRVYCLNNLKQMAVAAQIYNQTYDNYYPIAQYKQETGSANFEFCWDFTAIKEPGTYELIKVIPGLLWQGQTIEKIQQCPSFKGSSNWDYDPYTGYNYNTSYIGHGQGELVSNDYSGEVRYINGRKIIMPAKAHSVRGPGQCSLFGDGQFKKGANKFMRSPFKHKGDRLGGAGRVAGTQGYRHCDMTNVAWCDGHANSQKEKYTETYKFHQNSIADGTGFLSPDNSAYDLK